jgi:hypothetical protein
MICEHIKQNKKIIIILFLESHVRIKKKNKRRTVDFKRIPDIISHKGGVGGGVGGCWISRGWRF